MTDQSNDDQKPEEDHGEKYRTTLLTPTDSGIKTPESLNKAPKRRPQTDNGFNALLIANQHTYRRNNIVDAISYVCKRDPLAIAYFEAALADFVTDDPDAAAEG